ncbi:MFS transporter [Kiloniella spongiae]|uniref:MFS transporter n=2 Tax=Kiloniella spongiae TaxID=1489064 RepID=A0A0H2MTQ0_9PROT|nr:MFS transporter [Kiloniella spongiae]
MPEQTQRLNFSLILLGNAVLGTPMPMLIILGGLAGAMLAPSSEFAILPVSVQMMAGMLTAAPMSVFMGKYGRKLGFLLGATIAALGGALGLYSLFYENFYTLCLAHASMGSALVCFGYFRFAAAEVVSESWRPKAISFTLGSGLVAALVGPEVFIYSKDFFSPIPFAGAYGAITVLSVIGCLPILALRLRETNNSGQLSGDEKTASVGEIVRRPAVFTAILCAAISFGVMVLLMAPTPLAMVGCGFTDVQAGDVIRWHVIAMFAPSFFTGSLISRFGSSKIISCGLLMLCLSSAIAIAGIELTNFYLSLILLGLGWNFGFIGATNMLNENLSAGERSVVQGANDSLIALVSTLASFGSGILISSFSWTAVAVTVLPLVLIAFAGLIFLRPRVRSVA